MFQTDQSTAVSSLPTPATAATPGFFTGGNPGSGQAATILDADFLNMVMVELLNVVESAGLTPSKTTYTQVVTAIKILIQQGVSSVGTDTGAANAYVVAFTPALSAPVPYAPFWVKIKTANTGASTMNATGTVEPLVGGAHLALQGGELVANGNALIYWNPTLASGAGSYVLMFCSGAPVQVAPGTESEHAAQLGQTLGKFQPFTSSGTFTAPLTATYYFTGVAGGGGGGSGQGNSGGQTIGVGGGGGGGGGAGQPIRAFAIALAAGQTVAITIGAAGAPGVAGGNTVIAVSGGATTTLTGGAAGAIGNAVGSNSIGGGGAGGAGGSGFPAGSPGFDGNLTGNGGWGAGTMFGDGGLAAALAPEEAAEALGMDQRLRPGLPEGRELQGEWKLLGELI
jgi:hypothetical protein